MTRKDFELIARTIKQTRADFLCSDGEPSVVDSDGALSEVSENLADALATTNAGFNRERFLATCGVER